MLKKLTLISFCVFSVSCFAHYGEFAQCDQPTHLIKGTPWNHDPKWTTVTDAPNSDLLQIPDDTLVTREHTFKLFFEGQITCTYPLSNAEKLILTRKVSIHDISNWGTCVTREDTPEKCRISGFPPL